MHSAFDQRVSQPVRGRQSGPFPRSCCRAGHATCGTGFSTTTTSPPDRGSYASPILYRDDQREFLLSHGADYLVAHSLEDGRELWRCGDLNPPGNYNPTLRFVASPVAVPGLIVVPSAKNGPVFGLRPDGQGDITNVSSAFVWKRPQGTPDVPSPLIHNGLVYLCRENGNLICVDAETGEDLSASPAIADGCICNRSRHHFSVGAEFLVC